jgi:hypothetical protein
VPNRNIAPNDSAVGRFSLYFVKLRNTGSMRYNLFYTNRHARVGRPGLGWLVNVRSGLELTSLHGARVPTASARTYPKSARGVCPQLHQNLHCGCSSATVICYTDARVG